VAGHGAGARPICQHRPVGPTVLIVDDHAAFRAAARSLLEADGLRVVGEAGDGDEAVRETLRLRPQVVLLDVQLPGRDGFAVARELSSLTDPPAVVLVSSRAASDYGTQLAGANVCGFLTKRELSGAAVAGLIT
jgi:DNA-binding NarL/FixJ family response regulator